MADLLGANLIKLTDSLKEAHAELSINLIGKIENVGNRHFHDFLEREELVRLAEKLDLIEKDLVFIRNLLKNEKTSLRDLKLELKPVVGFFNTTLKRTKTVNFASSSNTITSTNTSTSMNSNTILDSDLILIAPLTTQEFETLPKYLKGRLTISKINGLIQELNKIIQEKYSLLAKSNSAKMSLDQRQRYNEWKAAQYDESNRFFSESDLKAKSLTVGPFKYDQITRNILTILRQIGRIKELRSAGIIRYILL